MNKNLIHLFNKSNDEADITVIKTDLKVQVKPPHSEPLFSEIRRTITTIKRKIATHSVSYESIPKK